MGGSRVTLRPLSARDTAPSKDICHVHLSGHTNTVESYFALLKRGVYGNLHNISEAHLHRYLSEFDFRHNTRTMSDAERGDEFLKGAKGKRLMYHQPREAANA